MSREERLTFEQFSAKLAAEIADAPLDKVAEKFPLLIEAITKKVREAAGTTPSNLKIDGFLLETSDPFAQPAASHYAKVSGTDVQRLPMVLPFAEKATIDALKNYLQRSQGAGDKARAKAAVEALKKLGVDVTVRPTVKK